MFSKGFLPLDVNIWYSKVKGLTTHREKYFVGGLEGSDLIFLRDALRQWSSSLYSQSGMLNQGLYSPTILKIVLSLVLQIFLHSETIEYNTTSDLLNHTV